MIRTQRWVSAAYTSNSFLLSSSLYPKFPRTQQRTRGEEGAILMALSMH